MTGAQIYDPDTGTFIYEGPWTRESSMELELPPQRGHYHVYVSPVDEQAGWDYAAGKPFLLIDAQVEAGRATLLETSVTTLSAMRRRAICSTPAPRPAGSLFSASSLRSRWQSRCC